MKLKIDFKRLGKWFKREALPILEPVAKVTVVTILVKSDITDEVRKIADKYNIPEEYAQEIAQQIKERLIDIVNEAG